MPRASSLGDLPRSLAILAGTAASVAGQVNFNDPVSFATGSMPDGLVAGDLDGDGAVDLVTTSNTGSPNDPLRIHWNDGNGGFATTTTLSAGDGPGNMALGDMDGDGDLDLFVSNYFSNDARFFRNNGDRTFQSAVSYATGGGCLGIATGDIDGDGDLDFVGTDKFGGRIRPYRNINGAGFSSVGLFVSGADPYDLVLGDVDGDGDLDAVVTNETASSVTIVRNAGDGTFPTRTTLATGERPTGAVLADLDADGDLDLATADWGPLSPISNTISVRLNDGDGGFGPRATYVVHGRPGSIAAGDVDGNGTPDLIVACEADDAFSVLPGAGDGTFGAESLFALGAEPGRIALADLDNDGDLDLAASGSSSSRLVVSMNITGVPIDPAPLETVWTVGHDNLFNEDIGTHVAVAQNGDIVVAGATTFQFNEEDFYILRFDSDGNLLWTHTYNGTADHYDKILALSLEDNGDITVAGISWGLSASVQWTTLRLDADGNERWVRRYDGGNAIAQQYMRGMTTNGAGKVAVCGWARDASFTTVHFTAAVYNDAGTLLWDVRVPDAAGVDGQAEAAAFDPAGNLYLTGGVDAAAGFGQDLMTAKVSPAGQVLWSRQVVSPAGAAVFADPAGNAYVTSGGQLLKYDSAGNLQWQRAIGAGMTTATRISPLGDGSVLVSGQGASRVSMARFDPDGTRRWAVQTQATFNSDSKQNHIAILPDDRFALVGSSGTDLRVFLYGGDGVEQASIAVDSGFGSDFPSAVAAGTDGAIFALGQYQPSILNRRDILLARVEEAGPAGCAPADLVEPFGVLDLGDVQAFIAGFLAHDPAADLDGNTVFDLGDVQAFLASFVAGCP